MNVESDQQQFQHRRILSPRNNLMTKKRQLEPYGKCTATSDENSQIKMNMSLSVPAHHHYIPQQYPQNSHFDPNDTFQQQNMYQLAQYYQNNKNNQPLPFTEQQQNVSSSHLLLHQKKVQPLQPVQLRQMRKNQPSKPKQFQLKQPRPIRFVVQKSTSVSNLQVEHPCSNRIDGISKPSQMVEHIHHAITKQQRIQVLEIANIFFHHDCTEAHDEEIHAGADNALCLKLGYVLLQYRMLEQENQKQFMNDADMMDIENTHDSTNAKSSSHQTITTNNVCNKYNWYELFLLSSALHKILHSCSKFTRQSVFEKVGKSELISLLVQILELGLKSQNKRMQQNILSSTKQQKCNQKHSNGTDYQNDEMKEDNDVQITTDTIEKTLQILHRFVKLGGAKEYFIYFQNGIFSSLLTNFLSTYAKIYDHFPTGNQHIQKSQKSIIQETMGIVKELTFYGVENKNEKENGIKKMTFYNHGLIKSIVGILSSYITNDNHISDEFKDISKEMKFAEANNSEVIKDKTAEYASKALWNLATVRHLQTIMVDKLELISILIQFSTNNNEKISNSCISAIGNLVSTPECGEKIIKFRNGYVVTKLLDISLNNGAMGIARRRAMRAFRFLASARSASLMMGNNPIVLRSLEKVILNDDDHETRVQGIQALISLSIFDYLGDQYDKFKVVLQLMLRIVTLSNDYKCVETICKYLPQFISAIYSYRPSLKLEEFSELDRAFSKVALGDEFSIECKLYIARLLHRFTQDEHNRLCLSSDKIIDSLSTLVEMNGLEKERVSTHAASAIVNLSKVEECRIKIASHESVLTNLVNYLVVAPEGMAKNEVKQTVLSLLPDL